MTRKECEVNENGLFEQVEKLRVTDPKLAVAFNAERTAISTLRGKIAPPVSIAELQERPFDQARKFIGENSALLGDIDEEKQLGDARATVDRRGMTHIVFHQKHGTARVLGATLSMHYARDGSLYRIKSTLVPKIDAYKRPKVSAKEAANIALEHAGAGTRISDMAKPARVVASADTLRQTKGETEYYLCWQLQVLSPEDSHMPDWTYFVDALEGKVLFRYEEDRTGTGTGRYSVGWHVNSEASGTTFRLGDTATSSIWPVASKPELRTYDDHGSTSRTLTNYSQDTGDTWDNGGSIPALRVDDQRPEVDVHRFTGYVMSYYYLNHGYNGWDGAGEDAKAHAHNERYTNNAYWSGTTQQIYFADGNGTTRDFMCPLDTVAHEYTHGVKYYYNVLQTYDGETGALDEATSDLFGAFVSLDHPADDPWPWQHGRQYRLDGTVGRNMVDPSRDTAGVVQYDDTNNTTKENSCRNGFYPDHYSIRYTGPEDRHGVHWNAPIISHAVYLMIIGGTHRLSGVTITGVGVGPIEQMLFDVISTGLLNNTSNFADFRSAFIDVCQSLYPDNLDYLAAVKSAFHAVGIGPDLYVRDRLADQGEEPGVLSCMSPDIIVRQSLANAATLALIADPNNATVGEQIELGPDDHYVYFRIFNRGSVSSSGTFRLFISPVSTFPTPASWHEVGHYDFPIVPSGGMWVPTAAAQCITLPAALINTLGEGHYCFIGIIECVDDPAPDRMFISDATEFHNFISNSNNYAWRNCDIIDDVHPDSYGEFTATAHTFHMFGFGRMIKRRELEIDARDLPEDTRLVVWLPELMYYGVKGTEVRALDEMLTVRKVVGALEEPDAYKLELKSLSMAVLAAEVKDADFYAAEEILGPDLRVCRPLLVRAGKIVRLAGLDLAQDDRMKIHFTVKFPKGTRKREVALAFRERTNGLAIGQMNYLYKIR
jgi:thermolysin